ncbi:MAG: peptidase U34 [Actinomycetota bacterium]
MCDTIVVINPDGVLFAKNSDRDANEAQFPEWHAAADHAPDATVTTTYLTIPQVPHTFATLLSRPFWMWGAEIGTNEHGVTIGNEAVFTDQPYNDEGLLGMDMIRLALERASTAESAVSVIVDLLERYGQGGGAGHENRSFTYHNSFIVADPTTAYVLETAGDLWAVEHVTNGVRTISNGLTIPSFAADHADKLRGRVAACATRTALTSRSADGAVGAGDLMAVLRSHGETPWPKYRALNGTLTMPCMHGGGVVTSSSSTAGWVSDLTTTTHWLTGTSAQCLSLFKALRVDQPVSIGETPTDAADTDSLWWHHERLARRVMADPATLAPPFLAERDTIEREWLASPPDGQDAWTAHLELISLWLERIGDPVRDARPVWARRYWTKRDRKAGL